MLSNMSGARSRKGCDGMSKAVLVMDMPERCADCPLRSSEKTSYVCCYLTLKNISSTDYYDKKPDWCPLRELPEKANHPAYCDNGRFDKGWNACLDMILEKKVNENVMPGTRNEKRTEGAQENEKRK